MCYNVSRRDGGRATHLRRLLCAILLAVILLAGNAQAALCVRMDDGAALLDRDGGEIVAPGTHSDIVSLGSGLYAAGNEGGLYALMDADGTLRTDFLYDQLRCEGDLLLAQRDGLWGMLRADGTPLSGFVYSWMQPNGTGGAWAIAGDRSDAESDPLYRVSASGTVSETGLRVHAVGGGTEGMLSEQLPGERRYGYCDAAGDLVIPAQFDYAGDFTGGLAAAVLDGRYGAIDMSGAWVLQPEYDFLQISPAGFILAAVELEGVYVFDGSGAELARYEGNDVYAALAGEGYVVSDPDALQLYDASGALLLETSHDASVAEGIGGQWIVSEGAWGETCVRLLGTDTAYQNLYPLGTAGEDALYACMTVNVGRYMNDKLGEIQLSTDMDSARYGVVGSDGEVLLEPVYRALYFLEDDRLLARSDEAWLVLDTSGEVYWTWDAPMQTEATSF